MHRRTALATLASLSTAGCLRMSGGSEGESEGAGDAESTPEADVWVAPDGDGDGSADAPFGDVERALDAAEPGERVYLQSGEYRLNGITHGSGEPDAPIEITGPEDAVLRAREGGTPVLTILHSHVHVTGCTFDGLADPERQWDDPGVWSRTVARVTPGPRYEEAGVDYLEDVVFEPHAMRNAGSTFAHVERTRDASLGDFTVTGPAGGEFHPEMSDPVDSHVGHLFQVGSSPPTIREYKPWNGLDRTRDVRIHHVDNSAGYHHSSLVNVRIGCEAVTVEYCTDRNAGNETSGQAVVAAVDVGGNNCTIRGNDLGDCRQGIVLGAWAPSDAHDASNWARNNDVYSNRLQGVERSAFEFFDTSPEVQRTLCDNRLVGVETGTYDYATGDCGDGVPVVDGIGHGAVGSSN